MKKKAHLPRSERPEKKAMNGQLRSMSDRDLLAIILGSGVAGNNVKKVATGLIRKFGDELLTIPAKDLCQIKGVGEVKAARLAAAFELYRRLSDDIARQPINTLADTQWLLQDLANEKQEILGYIALDTRNRPIDKRIDLYKGTESVTVADPKQIFKAALNRNAVNLIVYHNHPGGTPEPSVLDTELAARLASVGRELNLPVLDFVIVTKKGVHSLLGRYTATENPSYAAEDTTQLTLTAVLGRTISVPSDAGSSQTGFTFIDLFAGIGGIRLAFESAGGRCVWSCEWDQHAQQTYERNFGEMPRGDIKEFTGDDKSDADVDRLIPDHDVLCAGFPCQPFSLAGVSKKNSLGRKHGFDDPTQGTLFFDIKRILKAKRPAAFFLENVKHLMHHDSGKTFEIIRKTLEDDLGYVVNWQIVDASRWVPQSRKRIFLVGYNPKEITISKGEITIPAEPAPGYRYPELNRIINRYEDKRYMLGPGTWDTLERHKKHHAEAGNGFGYGLHNFPIPDGTVTRTISARYHKDGAEILIQTDGPRPRKLTIEEAAQLQGFDPTRFIFPVSDTQAYRQIGNSVAVPAVTASARQIAQVLKDRR